jgi:hypothetical protein
VIVERTRYASVRGAEDTCGYYVNMGHGSNPLSGFPHKWIFSKREGRDDTVCSAYFVRMQDESGPFEIVVNDALGFQRATLRGPNPGFRDVSFHVQNVKDSSHATVVVMVDALSVQTHSLSEGEDAAVRVFPPAQTVRLEATSGSQYAQKTVWLDYDPPTFASVTFAPTDVLGVRQHIELKANGASADFDSLSTRTLIPEPRTWMLAALGLGTLAILRRRAGASRPPRG